MLNQMGVLAKAIADQGLTTALIFNAIVKCYHNHTPTAQPLWVVG